MRNLIFRIFILLLWPSIVSAQPVISYLIPDIGTPGMNTYVEIIGPNGKDGNFGTDSLYLNNPGDAVQVVCANPSDSQYVRFGPCVVSWNGQMISTQAFVLPNVNATSTDWQQGIKIPIQVEVNGVPSQADTFFIVKPQSLGVNGTLSTSGALGSGGQYGACSKRGAMIVDSMILQNGLYDVSSANQGYLPLVILSLGSVIFQAGSAISVSAISSDGGPGAGGGGGGGHAIPGAGFASGGSCFGINNYTGSGVNGNSLNGLPRGGSNTSDQGGGGGSGFPFGLSGASGNDNAPSSPGGFGGGSGGGEVNSVPWYEYGGGGAGNNASGVAGVGIGDNSGKPVGNTMIVPISGGSGGGAGNQKDGGIAGSGGGGGGAISLHSFTSASVSIVAQGAKGLDGVSNPGGTYPLSGAGGGGGAGGNVLLGTRLGCAFVGYNSSNCIGCGINTSGGLAGLAADPSKSSSHDGGSASSGYARIDGAFLGQLLTYGPGLIYDGPTTDTASVVQRTFQLSGSGNGFPIRLFVRPLSSGWANDTTIIGYSGHSWQATINLQGQDSIYLLVAAQQVPNPSDSQYTSEPSWVLSQEAANILRVLGCSPPTAAILSNKSPVLCVGDSVILIANPIGLTYKWKKNSQLLPVTGDSLNASDSGIYSLIVSNACGSSDSTAVTVSVISAPVAGISGQPSFCAGGSTILTAMPAGFNYQWMKNGLLLQDSTRDSIMVTNSGTYSVIVSNGGECSDSTSIVVSMIPLPVASILPGTSIHLCAGSDTVLTARPSGMRYLWLDSSADSIGDSVQIRVANSGTYRVIVTNNGGCSDTAFTAVIQNPSVVATITATDTVLCLGSSATLKASGGMSYVWNTGDTTSVITPSNSGNYFVAVTDSNGCSAISRIVTVLGRPQPNFTLSGSPDTAICSDLGETYTRELTIVNNSDSSEKFYINNRRNASFNGVPDSIVLAPNQTIVFPVTVMTDGRMIAYSDTISFSDSCETVNKTVILTIYSGPKLSSLVVRLAGPAALLPGDTAAYSVLLGDTLPVCMNSVDFSLSHNNDMLSYVGTEGEVHLSSSSDPDDQIFVIDSIANGSVGELLFKVYLSKNDSTELTISNINFTDTCSAPGACISSTGSANITFIVKDTCGDALIQEMLNSRVIAIDGIIPNPASDAFTVSFANAGGAAIRYEIDDVLGRILTSGETSESQLSLSAQDLPAGVLLFRASSKGFVQTRRFVVAR